MSKPSWAVAFKGWRPLDSEEVVTNKCKWMGIYNITTGEITVSFASNSVGMTVANYMYPRSIGQMSQWPFIEGSSAPSISPVFSVPLPLP